MQSEKSPEDLTGERERHQRMRFLLPVSLTVP